MEGLDDSGLFKIPGDIRLAVVEFLLRSEPSSGEELKKQKVILF